MIVSRTWLVSLDVKTCQLNHIIHMNMIIYIIHMSSELSLKVSSLKFGELKIKFLSKKYSYLTCIMS